MMQHMPRGGEYVKNIDPLVFGRWVKSNRQAKKVTQGDLARTSGITRHQLIRIEMGQSGTSRETASAIALALECEEGIALRLAGYDGEPEPDSTVSIARQLEPYLMRLNPTARAKAEKLLVDQARGLSEVLA